MPGQYYDSESGLHYNYYRDYDPGLFELVETTMAYKGKVDWRYLP